MSKFNIRVYGLLLQANTQVLISDEHVFGRNISKFPGGGLQFGEGTIDCLKREFMEETGLNISVKSHFYTTDFFQPSFLDKNQQVISIYYLVGLDTNCGELTTSVKPFDFKEIRDGAQSFRWMDVVLVNEDALTLPIDKKVLLLLKKFLSENFPP